MRSWIRPLACLGVLVTLVLGSTPAAAQDYVVSDLGPADPAAVEAPANYTRSCTDPCNDVMMMNASGQLAIGARQPTLNCVSYWEPGMAAPAPIVLCAGHETATFL